MTSRISPKSSALAPTVQPVGARSARSEAKAEPLVSTPSVTDSRSLDSVEAGDTTRASEHALGDSSTAKKSAATRTFDPAQRSVRRRPAKGLAEQRSHEAAEGEPPTDSPVLVASQIKLGSRTQSQVKLGEPRAVKNFAFRGATQDAVKYPAQVGSHRFSIVVPKGRSSARQARDLAKSLSQLSPEALGSVRQVVKNPVQNPQDTFWARQYGMKDFTSAMTAGRDGVVTVYPTLDKRLGKVAPSLAHEIGHIVSKRAWGESYSGTSWKRWQQAGRQDQASPSDYATKSPGEDFAETFALYTRSQGGRRHSSLRAQFPNRFAIIDKLLGR